MQLKYPKMWLLVALLTFLLGAMLIIIKHNNSIDDDLKQEIYDHSK
jgi:hypothetical protein